MELKKGTTVKTFIPKVAEGVFTVICMFTDNNEYVLYYHSGKKTLRVFRTSDAQMIANYKMQAELTAIKSTKDGQSLVLGTVDGCLSVFCIADPEKPELQELLKQLPSRDINVRKAFASSTLKNIYTRFVFHLNSGKKSWQRLKRLQDSEQLILQFHLRQSLIYLEVKIERKKKRKSRHQQRLRHRQSNLPCLYNFILVCSLL
jgi:hypothetical protein